MKKVICLIVGIILLASVLAYIEAGKKAKFYTEITGIEMTRGDAFWLNPELPLRIVEMKNK